MFLNLSYSRHQTNLIWRPRQNILSPCVNCHKLPIRCNRSTFRFILSFSYTSFNCCNFSTISFWHIFSGVSFPKWACGSIAFQSWRRSLISSTLRVTRFACFAKEYLNVRDLLRRSIRHFKDIGEQGFHANLERNQCISFYAILWLHYCTWRKQSIVTIIASDILKNFTNNHHKLLFLNEEGPSHCVALIMPDLSEGNNYHTLVNSNLGILPGW